jgi:hypothetical protein
MSFAAGLYAQSLLSMSNADIGEQMRKGERAQGFAIVQEAPWLDWDDWTAKTIISVDGRHVRLVALEAREQGHGAFTRLIGKIQAAKLVPVIVEPNRLLIDWCERHHYRSRQIGHGRLRHKIWYPRR